MSSTAWPGPASSGSRSMGWASWPRWRGSSPPPPSSSWLAGMGSSRAWLVCSPSYGPCDWVMSTALPGFATRTRRKPKRVRAGRLARACGAGPHQVIREIPGDFMAAGLAARPPTVQREELSLLEDDELLRMIRGLPRGDELRSGACEALIDRYQRLVRSCVRQYQSSPESAEELRHVGYIVLITTIMICN